MKPALWYSVVLCAFVTLNVIVSDVFAQHHQLECATGSCVSIYDCPQLLSLLKSKFLTQSIVKTLRQAQCTPTGPAANSAFVCCDNGPAPSVNLPPTRGTYDSGRPSQLSNPSSGLGDEIPSHVDCGIESTTRKIIGGAGVELDEFPWMAILEYERREL